MEYAQEGNLFQILGLLNGHEKQIEEKLYSRVVNDLTLT